jgi:DNA-binding transcriptional ArsR family regulator
MFPSPDKTPEFEYRLARVLEHPVRIDFLRLLAGRDSLSPTEALDHLAEDVPLPLCKVTYHARVLDYFGLVEAAGQPGPDSGVPFRLTTQGEFALAALGYTPREGRS